MKEFIHFTFNTTDFAVRTKFLASYLKKDKCKDTSLNNELCFQNDT